MDLLKSLPFVVSVDYSQENTQVHHKTSSVTTHVQSHLILRPRMAAKIKCFVSCSSSSSARVVVELDFNNPRKWWL